MRVYLCFKCGMFTFIKNEYPCCPLCSNEFVKLSWKDKKVFYKLNGKQRIQWIEEKNGYPIPEELNAKREDYWSQVRAKRKREAEEADRRAIAMSQYDPVCVPKCPTCQSTNIRKIGGIERGASVATLGMLSNKINKTFKCNNCGCTW